MHVVEWFPCMEHAHNYNYVHTDMYTQLHVCTYHVHVVGCNETLECYTS